MNPGERRTRQRCEAIAAGLPIPVPFGLEAFASALAERRGRALHLVPVTTRAPIPTGMAVCTDIADYIFYAADTTQLHQWHIVAHEVGHLVFGHRHNAAMEAEVAAVLMPNLSLELVRRVLGRTVPDTVEEREAELLAYAILRRAGRTAPPVPPDDGDRAEGLARLNSAIRPPADGRERR